MSMPPNSGKYAYCVAGTAEERSGPALGGADSLKHNIGIHHCFETESFGDVLFWEV